MEYMEPRIDFQRYAAFCNNPWTDPLAISDMLWLRVIHDKTV